MSTLDHEAMGDPFSSFLGSDIFQMFNHEHVFIL